MANDINLAAQAQVVRNILHWRRRTLMPLQISQLEAVERTLIKLQTLQGRFSQIQTGNADEVTDKMAAELIELLQLERA